jgi:perosamine synthetase
MKIPYGKQWISDDDSKRVLEVLKSDFLTTGPYVSEFEEAFAKFVGSKYAVAVANGTAALHLSAKALGVKKGTQVITTPMSFAATSNCVLYNSGEPVFADITNRGLIDPEKIDDNITDTTIGFIPVHYMGLPSNLKAISKLAKESGAFIIEDASHALGAKYCDSSIGDCKYSNASVFSLHPVKHITTGEGGIITTNDEELNDLLRLLRTHGITTDQSKFKTNHREPWYQEMQYLGFNYRLTDIQAALGLSQLERIDEFIKRRRQIAKTYVEFFEDYENQVQVIPEKKDEFHSYHLFVIKLATSKLRRELYDHLKKTGIYCQIHYIPIYRHPYYYELGYRAENYPNSERFYEGIISLPMYPALSDEELEIVLSSLREFLH